MKKPQTQIRLQLGSLLPHVQASAEKAGHSVEIEIRRILAEYFEVPAPAADEFRSKPKSHDPPER